MTNAFVTGSRVYGAPHENSDIDLCVVVNYDDLTRLRQLADKIGGSDGDSLVFGRLNLLCLSGDDFQAWKGATDTLIAQKPVSRERAVEVIEQVKAECRAVA